MENQAMESDPKKNRIEFWIKLWGVSIVLAGLSTLLVKNRLENVVVISGYGVALIWAKRIHSIWILGLIFSSMWIIGSLFWVYYHTTVQPDFFQQVYFSISSFFYIGFFIFLLTPNTKEVFGPSLIAKDPLLDLTPEESRWIKFLIRLLAVVLVTQSLVENIFSDWFRSHGVPAGGVVSGTLAIIAALGLLFFRPNIGRRLCLFV